jgi:hypothetical protein
VGLRFAGLTFERSLESMDVGGPEAAAATAVKMAHPIAATSPEAIKLLWWLPDPRKMYLTCS